MTFPPFENSDHAVVSVSIEFPTNSNLDVPFHWIAHDYSHADWDCLVIIREVFHVRISLNSVLLLLLMNFVSGFRLELMYTSLIVSIRSKPLISWFSAACAVAITHRNHFFRLYKEKRSPESKVKFRQASNCSKRVLEAVKHAYTTKTKESITSQKLGSWKIANSVLNKGKSATSPLFNGPEVLSSASVKAKLFAQNFSNNSGFDDSGISLPIFPSRTNLKLHNISITPKMVKKVITNHDSSNVSGPDCIPVLALKNSEPELSYILAELFNICLKELFSRFLKVS